VDLDHFWKLIADSRRKAGGDQASAVDHVAQLTTILRTLPPDELISFDTHLWERMAEAYRWDLWAVAYLMNGGCSDDGFDYFCGWLISRGRIAFEKALAEPESAGKVGKPGDDHECADLLEVGARVWEEKTGGDFYAGAVKRPARGEIRGEPFDEDNVTKLYPKLARRYG
jgi:hypothetical protein